MQLDACQHITLLIYCCRDYFSINLYYQEEKSKLPFYVESPIKSQMKTVYNINLHLSNASISATNL